MCETAFATGCTITTEGKMRNAEALLEQKYGEEFCVKEYGGQRFNTGVMMGGWYTVWAFSKKYPDIVFEANIGSDNGITDTYVERRVGCALKEQVENVLKELDGGFVVYAMPTDECVLPLNPDITPERFNEERPRNEYYIELFFDKKKYSTRQMYESVKEIVSKYNHYSGRINTFVTDAETLSKVAIYYSEHDKIYSDLKDILFDSDSKHILIDYENGKVLASYEDYIGGLR